MRKYYFFLLIIIFVMNGSQYPALASDPGYAPMSSSNLRIELIDANPIDHSRIIVYRETKSPGFSGTSNCLKIGVAPCDQASHVSMGVSWGAELILPRCETASSEFCVSSFSIYKSGSVKKEANYLGMAPGSTLQPQPEFGLPKSGDALLYEAPNAPNAGGTATYALKFREYMVFNHEQNKFVHGSFAIFIQPYTLHKSSEYVLTPPTPIDSSTPFPSTISDRSAKWTAGDISPAGYNISRQAWSGDGESGLIADFNLDTRFAVTVRIPPTVGGWFSGRLSDPKFQLESMPSRNELSVDALAISVPRIRVDVPTEKATPFMKRLGMTPGMAVAVEAGSVDAAQVIEEMRSFVNDTSSFETSAWVVRETEFASSCFPRNKVTGLVATNANAYSWDPPVLNNGFLDYKVAGMHYSPNKTPEEGTYDLILDSSVARCLYGFDNTPISASITVIGDNNVEKKVSTTLVSENDGYLKLAAYGFGFSSPIIRVKLSQAKSASGQSPKSPVKKSTITCVKGKSTKKVTAVKPVCPSGYKKK